MNLLFAYKDHSGTPADTNNYNLLLRDLRSKLDELGQSTNRFYGLTAALPCGTSNIANIDIDTVAKYLTEFNLMTYGELSWIVLLSQLR
jgi:chitinase